MDNTISYILITHEGDTYSVCMPMEIATHPTVKCPLYEFGYVHMIWVFTKLFLSAKLMVIRTLTLKVEDSSLISDGECTVVLVVYSNYCPLQLYGGSSRTFLHLILRLRERERGGGGETERVCVYEGVCVYVYEWRE